RVNGNDPDEGYGALSEAVDRARSGGGPTLVECMTFRLRGHSIGDDNAYMKEGELSAREAEDPVPAYRKRLLDSGACTEKELAAIDASATAAVNDAVKTVTEAPFP